MRKLAILLVLSLAHAFAWAQGSGSNLSRVAGFYVASAYNNWSMRVSQAPNVAGTVTLTVQSSSVLLSDGRLILPFNTNAPLLIDQGSNQETVTPIATSGCSFPNVSCSITATFALIHGAGTTIRSGSFGLQEAINDASLGNGGLVLLDSSFAGSTATITAAAALSNVTIEDARLGVPVFYTKVGTVYVQAPSGGGGGGALFQVNGSNTPNQATINFQSGTNIAVSNPSIGNIQFAFSGPLPLANVSGVLPLANTPLTTRGDTLVVNSVPALGRLALGPTNSYLKSNGSDLIYSSNAAGGAGACGANNWVNALNADSAPGCAQPAFANLTGSLLLAQTPLTTSQDLLIANATPALARFAVCPNGQFLGASGGVWTCSTPSVGSLRWDQITAPTANLTLANVGFSTTYNHTSAVNWTWANTTPATSGVCQSSPIFNFNGQYWTGAASAADSFTLQNVCTNGSNGAATLTYGHSGSTGPTSVQYSFPNAGAMAFGQGASQSPAPAASAGWQAPASVSTKYFFTMPAAPAVGFLRSTAASDPSAITINAASGVGACTGNQLVSALNDNAAPTCSSPSASSFTSFPRKAYFDAAGCSAGTGSAAWDTAQTAVCNIGTNVYEGVLQFTATSQTAQFKLPLPADWVGAIDARLSFYDSATSGTVTPTIATACTAGGAGVTDDTAFNTANNFGAITLASPANALWTATVTGITTTGCTAGNWMQVRIGFSAIAGTVNVRGAELTLRSTF